MTEKPNPQFLAQNERMGRKPDSYSVGTLGGLTCRRAMGLARLAAAVSGRPCRVDAVWHDGAADVKVLFATMEEEL
jgi:hypothetical protein